MSTVLQNLTVQSAPISNTAATQDNHLLRLGEARPLVAAAFAGQWKAATTYATGIMVSSGWALYVSQQGANKGNAPASSPAWWQLVLDLSGMIGGPVPTHIQLVAGTSTTLYATLGVDLTGQTVNFIFERLLPAAASSGGFTLDLSAAESQTRTATIGEAGQCSYTLTTEDTATPGYYRGQFQFTSGGVVQMFPPNGWIEFEVVAAAVSTTNNLYVAYASDASGSGFSLSPADGLGYIAFKVSTTAKALLTAADFAGAWVKIAGLAGDAGSDGATGAAGTSSYLTVAYASDASGTGFSLTPGSGLGYIAFKISSSPLTSPVVGDFAGLWLSVKGAPGAAGAAGAAGANGTSSYLYIGFASAVDGTAYSPTPGAGLNYIAFKVSTTVISSPQAADFAGLWHQYAVTPPTVAGVVKSDGSGTLAVATADDLPEATSAPTNLWFTTARVLATALTGLSGTLLGSVVAADTILQAFAKLQNRLAAAEAALASPGQATFAEGQVTVANGGQTAAVTGLSLGFTPTRCQLTVQAPTGATTVLAATLIGAPTADGFVWRLSAAAPATGYILNYRLT